MAVRKPRVVDLFCGAGGLSLGLELAGLDVVQAVDHWAQAVETYRANLHHPIVEDSIVPGYGIAEADVIVGGPPCQGFSSAGMRRADDARNTLVGVFATIVAEKRPKAFVFENVEGFLTGGDGRFVFDLLGPVIEAGYRVHLRKINAANFGIPQHRKRVLAIGGLGWDPVFPEPTHFAFGAPGASSAHHGLPRTPTLGDALQNLPAPAVAAGEMRRDGHDFVPLVGEDLERARLLGEGQRMRDLPEELWHESYRRRAFRRVMDGTPTERRGGAPAGVRRLAWDEPSKAMTGGAAHEFLHPREDRPLTVRECARLQTFPDEFVFLGNRGDCYQQIGNAVPPRLAEVVGKVLVDSLPRTRARSPQGALLSFVPTVAAGMSPVLRRTVDEVERRFLRRKPAAQGELWA